MRNFPKFEVGKTAQKPTNIVGKIGKGFGPPPWTIRCEARVRTWLVARLGAMLRGEGAIDGERGGDASHLPGNHMVPTNV